ncbi:hypothetical protein G9U51_12690 [Calidifontibacter sp. DB0510]|uniref:Uncharacterized protein n=1 Tax=Metallococcus carri TaxID=1656884 RepID=A0A967B333_9MICO|nr:hypothetical protein [Metallococcus carri]NHN56638.1 hypothetical protein [Metallococcus carri]NOP38937.1 hypothetical protein [Calidifontibacter sp. DB2511S]
MLTVRADGTATERVDSGCCTNGWVATYRLQPAKERVLADGTRVMPIVLTSFTTGPAWERSQPAPKVGTASTLRLRQDMVSNLLLTGDGNAPVTFCGPTSRECGA